MTEQQILERVDTLYNKWEQANEGCSVEMFLGWVADQIGE